MNKDAIFKGFPAQSRLVRIPELFFQEVMPKIDDIDELRVTLYTLWYLERMDQPIKFIFRKDYLRDKSLMSSLGADQENHLVSGLQKAITRGTLLSSADFPYKAPDTIIMANTARSHSVLSALKSGKYTADQLSRQVVQMDILRPNIYELYEHNIGAITPMMAEILKDAENQYPTGWIEEAIELAVQNNSRRWRYVEAILRKWKENGRDGEY